MRFLTGAIIVFPVQLQRPFIINFVMDTQAKIPEDILLIPVFFKNLFAQSTSDKRACFSIGIKIVLCIDTIVFIGNRPSCGFGI